MPLPSIPFRVETIEVEGHEMTVRGLSRQDIHTMSSFEDGAESEAYMLSKGCDVSIAEAKQWLADTPLGAADRVLEAIQGLSYVDPKSSSEPS